MPAPCAPAIQKGTQKLKPQHELKIWDAFVRIFHWVLAAAFAICYITEGKPKWIHINSGYIITVLVVLRVLWGFVGPRHARFNDFVRGPKEVFEHLREVMRFKARRYLGHDPAGGIMIVALLACLSITVLSGMLVYGAKDKAGPFAGFANHAAASFPPFQQEVLADDGKGKTQTDRGKEGKSAGWLEEMHESFANLTFALVCIHICGVLLVSLETRENLVRSMINGKKTKVGPF